MPGMPDLILKAPALDRLEKLSRIKNMKKSPLLTDAIKRLGGDPKKPENRLLKVARDMGLYASDAEAEHFKQHWLNDPPGSENACDTVSCASPVPGGISTIR
jgi:hypothetical protein